MIPNAVDAEQFKPDYGMMLRRKKERTVNIVFVSRHHYRKGVDILLRLIPKIIAKYDHVNFIIGGDGPMKP